ncbi:glycoside hydrolase family 32 protein [Granulicella rosea]|nr:glycoside hydrolase family 32 protein [Granulicella rosea]
MRFSLTRRDFFATVTALALAPRAMLAETEPLEARLAADPMRPQFHLLPAKNWMNDPNGPIYFNGKYHMFFQYNPLAATWGDMSWYHAVSEDMLHWKHLPLAFTPTPGSADAFGCFSGSCIQVGKRVYAVYTGTKESSKELSTIKDGEDRIQESQCLAYSDDSQLIRWTKLPEPIVPLPPPGLKITGFRDPSVWKQGEWFYMTVGSGIALTGGCVLLYRSKDMKTWEYLHELTSGKWNGVKTANPCPDGEMWECPEFFALDGGHVLIYSTLDKVFWQSGRLDAATMTFEETKTGELDLGAFYAPKTQLDAVGRRILWGWIPEKRSEAAMRDAGWSGMMSLPRVLHLDADGTLRITSLPQAAVLRAATLPAQKTHAGVLKTLPEATGELLCTGLRGSPMQLTMTAGASEVLRVLYSPEKHAFLVAGREIALKPNDAPTVHGFVDGSVVELILGERIGYTKRFYYDEKIAPDVKILATGAAGIKLDAWRIAPISPNRLTAHART